MTQLWMDGFDHYGTSSAGVTNMLNGSWAEVDADSLAGDGPVAPSFAARSGDHALQLSSGTSFARRVIGSTETTIMWAGAIYIPEIPQLDNRLAIVSFLSAGTTTQGTLYCQSDGSITLRGPETDYDDFRTAPFLGTTTGPALVAGTWHHIEVQFTSNASTGACEVRVDEQVVLNLTNINTGGTGLTQLFFGFPPNTTAANATVLDAFFYYDMICRDTAGSVNNTFQGDLRVAFLQPVANGANQGWTTRSIQKLGNGVMNFQDTNRDEAIAYDDNAALTIGNQDFCIEGFVRFASNLVVTEAGSLFSKYRVSNDTREWRLFLNGPDVGGTLEFATSTDGTLATVETVHEFPFTPEIFRWYHIAVSREGTTSRMFIDGQQVGVDQVDNRTYYDGTAQFFVNNQQGNGQDVAISGAGIDCWMDGVRFTVGAARYTANFTPPTEPLPTNNVDDPLYDDVSLLLNFEGNIDDGSTNGFVGTILNDAFTQVPDDAVAYQTVNGEFPNDANFIEAALIAATGTLTFTANPLDTEQVVIGSTTYTFQTTLVDVANNVLIGATAEDSLDNLLAAVNQEAGEGTLYGTGTVQNTDAMLTDLPDEQVLATARTSGAVGNSVATTTTVTGASWSGATLSGGADIPSNSEFTVSQLPPEVTGVRAVAIISRALKTDSGSSTLQASFVTNGGSSAQGDAHPVTTSATYYEDTFEEDPNTMGAITPSTLLNARIRLDRTA